MSRLLNAVRNAMLAATAASAGFASTPLSAQTAQTRASTSEGLSAWERVVMEATFSKADADDDGHLTRLETARLAAFTDRFDALDADQDGTLDLEEFAVGFATAH